jgi:hypothetical protein
MDGYSQEQVLRLHEPMPLAPLDGLGPLIPRAPAYRRLDTLALTTARPGLGFPAQRHMEARASSGESVLNAGRHRLWRLPPSSVSRIVGDASEFFGHKDAIGVGSIVCKRGTRFKAKTGI